MKKLIVVIMALITIFSASVSVHAYSILEGAINGSNLDLITNLSFGSRNCTLVYWNSTSPDVTATDSYGNAYFQKTTYNALLSLYEQMTTTGVSLAQNFVRDRTYEWYVADGHCFILVNGDRNGAFIQNQLWTGNYDGKILYCDAPSSETGYTISAIAGASGYYLTDRPVGDTTGNYLGDLCVTSDNLSTMYNYLSNAGGSYYTVLWIIDGEYRYYLSRVYGVGVSYYVCNSSGQLYYAVKESGNSGGTGDGTTFDDSEIVAGLNSVYDALDVGFYDVCRWLKGIQTDIQSMNSDILYISQNMVNGFSSLNRICLNIEESIFRYILEFASLHDDLGKYLRGLGRSYGEYRTVELSGEDTLFEWSEYDVIQNLNVSHTSGQYGYVEWSSVGNELTQTSSVSIVNAADGYDYYPSSSGRLGISCIPPSSAGKTVYSNFVSNADFRYPLNSNGNTVYTANGACIDKWMLYGSTNTFTVADGYCNYSVSSSSSYCSIYHPLGIDYEVGKTYTISILAKVNSLSGTAYFKASNGAYGLSALSGYRVALSPTSDIALFTTTFTNNVELYDKARVDIIVNAGSTIDIDIYAVKVECSSSQSLAFEGYDDSWYLFTDVYTPPNVILAVGGDYYTLSTSLSCCGNSSDRIYYDTYDEAWKVYRYDLNSSSFLPLYDQEILNKFRLPSVGNYAQFRLESITADSLSSYFCEGQNFVTIEGDSVLVVDYYHAMTWFEYMHSAMEKLYDRFDSVDEVEGKLDVITTTLTTQNGYVDEVESKLTSLESTTISQHEDIINYWALLEDNLTSWGMMHVNGLYDTSFSQPVSYLRLIVEGLYAVMGSSLGYYDYADNYHSYGELTYEAIENISEKITTQHEDVIDYWALLQQGITGWGNAQMMYLEGYYNVLSYLFAKTDNLGDIVASYPKLTYEAVDGLETTLSNIYDRLGDIEDAVVSADNVIIDITTDNDAFNIFYITKTDGTSESVGTAAKDAAVVVGEFLSVFYRLIFADGLDNADIIHDFEEVYTVTDSGVNVW